MALYESFGANTKTALLASQEGVTVVALPMEPSQGTLKAGAVVYRKDTGLWYAAGASQCIDDNALAVLAADVDTTGSETIAEDAVAYISGKLNAAAVKLASNGTITAAKVLTLRKQGIVLVPVAGAGEFNNVYTAPVADDDDNADET